MGLFSNLGKLGGKILQYGTPAGLIYTGAKAAVPALGKGVSDVGSWLGQKPAGAQQFNDMLNQELGNTVGKVGAPPTPSSKLDDFVNNWSPSSDDPFSSFNNQIAGRVGDMSGRLGKMRERSDQDYEAAKNLYNKFAENGGIDPTQQASINQNRDRLRLFGKFGAESPEQANRVRGNGVFDEFANTGGYSDSDIANIRARGNATGASIFSGLKRNLETGNAVSGGANPGYTAQMAKMARDSARAANESSLDTELGIKDKVNAGRQWGSSNLSDAEKSLIANMLGGTQAANQTEMDLMKMIQQGKQFGASGLSDLYHNPGADASYENLMNSILGTQLSGINASNANRNQSIDQYLKAMGMQQDRKLALLGMLGQRNPNQTNFDKYGMPLINTGASIGAMFA